MSGGLCPVTVFRQIIRQSHGMRQSRPSQSDINRKLAQQQTVALAFLLSKPSCVSFKCMPRLACNIYASAAGLRTHAAQCMTKANSAWLSLQLVKVSAAFMTAIVQWSAGTSCPTAAYTQWCFFLYISCQWSTNHAPCGSTLHSHLPSLQQHTHATVNCDASTVKSSVAGCSFSGIPGPLGSKQGVQTIINYERQTSPVVVRQSACHVASLSGPRNCCC